MFNLYEIIAKAQGGAAMANLARMYGLSPEQTRAAVEAMLPAFALGFKRATETPDGLSQFFNIMARNPYADWFESAGRLFATAQQAMGFQQPAPPTPGEDILTLLFGSKEASRAVAAHAAALSGVGVEATKAMMPAVGALIAGGMPQAAQAQAGMAEAFQGFFAAMAPQRAPEPPPPPGPAEVAAAWTSLMQSMLGQSPPKAPPSPVPDFTAMAEQVQDLGRSGNATFGKLFEAGVDAQKANLDRINQIFDSFLDHAPARQAAGTKSHDA
ncbi:DUF937 domain-containing protein [Blastochloris viridis]|uniref:DUF937 domain-containing protein n=1 Tax=Blastochloris viridis TaxID=1079 RepID=A0A0H5BPL5_BLAVI|nr:DUF937 domain-containing protein [Blastochloris viridis]ALK10548.1 hypothetical protein BVIR_2783 [Blastochloris viridis]BAR99498.1 hypothetical protein BV133_1905 [Blastochloris viridis]CUU43210.1 hypothetical protein BVIRIDIS_22270 [Blastochloris viridis]